MVEEHLREEADEIGVEAHSDEYDEAHEAHFVGVAGVDVSIAHSDNGGDDVIEGQEILSGLSDLSGVSLVLSHLVQPAVLLEG